MRRSELGGAVAVITGAAGGIGSAIARRLSGAGVRLALVDRSNHGLLELQRELDSEPSTHLFDLSRYRELDLLAAEILDAHGHVDILINNAGTTVHGILMDQTPEEIDRVLDVNLRAVIHAVRAFVPLLRDRPESHIVNVSSMAGIQGFPFQVTYSAAKFGVRGFGQGIRAELHSLGIGSSTILPGTIATAFLRNTPTHDPVVSAQLATLMERFGTSPERVARAVERAILTDRAEILVGWDAHLVALVSRTWPGLVPKLLEAMTAIRKRAR